MEYLGFKRNSIDSICGSRLRREGFNSTDWKAQQISPVRPQGHWEMPRENEAWSRRIQPLCTSQEPSNQIVFPHQSATHRSMAHHIHLECKCRRVSVQALLDQILRLERTPFSSQKCATSVRITTSWVIVFTTIGKKPLIPPRPIEGQSMGIPEIWARGPNPAFATQWLTGEDAYLCRPPWPAVCPCFRAEGGLRQGTTMGKGRNPVRQLMCLCLTVSLQSAGPSGDGASTHPSERPVTRTILLRE